MSMSSLRAFALTTICALLVLPAISLSQEIVLPTEINGQWFAKTQTRGGTISEKFSLKEIKPGLDQSFSAKLTWWSYMSQCSVRDEPITGKVASNTISWEFTTRMPCGNATVAELTRTAAGWEGKTWWKSNPSGIAELKAE